MPHSLQSIGIWPLRCWRKQSCIQPLTRLSLSGRKKLSWKRLPCVMTGRTSCSSMTSWPRHTPGIPTGCLSSAMKSQSAISTGICCWSISASIIIPRICSLLLQGMLRPVKLWSGCRKYSATLTGVNQHLQACLQSPVRMKRGFSPLRRILCSPRWRLPSPFQNLTALTRRYSMSWPRSQAMARPPGFTGRCAMKSSLCTALMPQRLPLPIRACLK